MNNDFWSYSNLFLKCGNGASVRAESPAKGTFIYGHLIYACSVVK